MKGDWYEMFKKRDRLLLTKETAMACMSALSEDLPVYLRYLDYGDSILECCCGPGYTAIPLSHHFKVTGIDKDKKVLECARENAEKFGGEIRFVEMDSFDLAEKFGKNSFDACSSGGVLEHFDKKQVRTLLDIQLQAAPVVFAQMPLGDGGGGEIENEWGIVRYDYNEKDWLEDILVGYNILEHRRLPRKPDRMHFREFMVVIGR